MATKDYRKRDTIERFSRYDIESRSPQEIITLLNPFVNHPVYSDITFEIEEEHGYYNDVSISFQLRGWRDETEAERNKRLADAQKARERDKRRKQLEKDSERAEYERLKKKFEHND